MFYYHTFYQISSDGGVTSIQAEYISLRLRTLCSRKNWPNNAGKSKSRPLTVFRKPYRKIIWEKHNINNNLLSIPRNNSTIPLVTVILKHVNNVYYNKCLKSIYKGELTIYMTKIELNCLTEKCEICPPSLKVIKILFSLPHGKKTAYRPNFKHINNINGFKHLD